MSTDKPGTKSTAKRTAGKRRKSRAPSSIVKGRLRAHDPFELIRWVAFSQTDPRKALAELVQNSLDAEAGRVHVSRLRHRGVPCLRVFDDGQGVIPEMERREALKYIATHIGHSRKRSLSPRERLALMTQGQYGIGLLGFWCLGEVLEMRTSVPGQKAHRLILFRDRPDYRIEPLRGRLALEERWTEIIVSNLHPEASRILLATRTAEFLAAELRGQLLARKVEVVVEDRMARGRARRSIRVRPRRFLGERLEGLSSVPVPGRPPIRLEIYYAGDTETAGECDGIAVYAAGTLVAEGFGELEALGLDHPPWTDGRLTGLVDYAGFAVAPGNRRGVVPDAAAAAFVGAITPVESVLLELLEGYERRKAEEIDRTLIRDLQRAFRNFYRQRPSYAMLPVAQTGDPGAGPPGAGQLRDGQGDDAGSGAPPQEADVDPSPPPDLLPPGPLAAVRVWPGRLRMEPETQRSVKATAVDVLGRPVEQAASFQWTLAGSVGEIASSAAPDGAVGRATVAAGSKLGEGTLSVTARSGLRECQAEVPVYVVEEIARRSSEGIPEPELADKPAEPWRSRMTAGRWQVNSGHRDYRAVADQMRLKLRYLAMLFAKEVVLRSRQDPRLEQPLEQMVEVMSYADRQISTRRKNPRGAATVVPRAWGGR